jgi:hypothetical protein
MCVICVLCLIVVPLPPGENAFAVKYKYIISLCSQRLQVVHEENPASDHKLKVPSDRAQAYWVLAQVMLCGICGGQSGTGAFIYHPGLVQ